MTNAETAHSLKAVSVRVANLCIVVGELVT
jgi:hypothetical protein